MESKEDCWVGEHYLDFLQVTIGHQLICFDSDTREGPYDILGAMNKSSNVLITLIFLGLIITNVAVFAEALGLDKNPGNWGKARISIFVVGLVLILLTGAYYLNAKRIKPIGESIFERFKSWIAMQQTFGGLFRYFQKHGFVLPIVLFVVAIYAWFTSSGTWTNWGSTTYYYANLADGFRDGKLSIRTQPDPRLSKLLNPYDPSARLGIEVPVDITYYNGRYYLYWGPIPALIILVVQRFFDVGMGDLQLAFAFVSGIFVMQTLLIHAIWNYHFRELPRWLLYTSVLLMGLAGPLMLLRHNYENARIYEASITGGQFFLIGGLTVILTDISKTAFSGWRFATVGALWMLAIGTRQILAVPIGAVVLLLTYWHFKNNGWSIRKTTQLIPLGLALVFGFVGLGWYNWARFGSLSETGLYYTLIGMNLQEHYKELFSLSYVFQNLYNYLFNSIDFTLRFPFVFMPLGSENPIFSFYSVPDLYYAQPITGLLHTIPFAIFAVVPVLALFFGLIARGATQNSVDDDKRRQLDLVTLSLICASLMAFSMLMLYFWVGMRFSGDFIPSLMILSAIGFWQGYQFLIYKPLIKRVYVLFGLTLAGMSIALSVLLAISTNSKLVNFIIHRFPSP